MIADLHGSELAGCALADLVRFTNSGILLHEAQPHEFFCLIPYHNHTQGLTANVRNRLWVVEPSGEHFIRNLRR